MPITPTSVEPVLLTPIQLSQRIGITVPMLSNWRTQGIGPTYRRLTNSAHGRVRYHIDDVIAWENSLTVTEASVSRNFEAAHGA